jgi:probable rRNA maturation factor
MILLDPHLDTDAAPKALPAKRTTAASATAASNNNLRLPSAQTLARFLAAAQEAVGLKGEVTILLTTDAAIKGLNRRFRGKNKATDVLSFPAAGPDSGPRSKGIAGDLAISVTTALGQAAGQGHSLSTEIKVLVLHGLLHLAGYDHETDNGQMARREQMLRGRLGLPHGLIERNLVSEQIKSQGKSPSGAKARASSAGGNVRAKARTLQARPFKVSDKAERDEVPPRPFKTAARKHAVAKAARS